MKYLRFSFIWSALALALFVLSASPLLAQQITRQVIKTSPGGVPYLEYLPQGAATSGEKYPVLIYLHGAGDKGDGTTRLIGNLVNMGPPKEIENGSNMTFVVNGREEKLIVISPQLSWSYSDFMPILPTFINEIFERYAQHIDRSRVYLTGISMGGGGTWAMAAQNPNLFAAVVPVCGAAWPQTSQPCSIASANLPVWAHHGTADNIISLAHSSEWVNRINACQPTPNPRAQLREYPGLPHDISAEVFTPGNTHNPTNIYQWMLQYSRPLNVTWNGSTWSPQAPKALDNVTISGNYPSAGLATKDFVCNNLTVASGATLTIEAGVTIATNGRFDYAGTVVVENGGSFVQGASATAGSQTGTFTIWRQRYGSQVAGPGLGYNFWSAPVAGLTIANLPGVDQWKFFYNEPTQAWALASGALQTGRGYTATLAGMLPSVSFSGRPNNGDFSLNVVTAGRGSNLVGNPYPSALDLQAFFADPANAELNGTAWFWDDSDQGDGRGTYLIANQLTGRRYAPACQGFFVQATTPGSITFKNQHRAVANNQLFYRGEGSDFILVELRVQKTNGPTDRTYLGLGQTFSQEFDKHYDSYKVANPSGMNLSIVWENQQWGSLALPESGTSRQASFPLALQVREAGEYRIALGEATGFPDRPLFLEDRATGELYFLQPGREHSFTLPAGNYANRFLLRFANEVVGNQAAQPTSAPVYSFADRIYLAARGQANEVATVIIYDTTGAEVRRFEQVQATELAQGLATQVYQAGIYLVKISVGNQKYEQRVWLGQ
jgi:predicted esterase